MSTLHMKTESTVVMPRHFNEQRLRAGILSLAAQASVEQLLLIRTASKLAGRGEVKAAAAILRLVADRVKNN